MVNFYEFFAGGGMARADLGPDWQCLLANDFDPKKAASYAANWGDDHLRVGDVAALTTADLPAGADLAWASFPCQDLSLAGIPSHVGLIEDIDGENLHTIEGNTKVEGVECVGRRVRKKASLFAYARLPQ